VCVVSSFSCFTDIHGKYLLKNWVC